MFKVKLSLRTQFTAKEFSWIYRNIYNNLSTYIIYEWSNLNLIKNITCSWTSNSFSHFSHIDDYCFDTIAFAFDFGHKSRHFIPIECITDIPIYIYATHVCSKIVPLLSITRHVSLNGCDFLCRLQQYFDVLFQQISIKIRHLKV